MSRINHGYDGSQRDIQATYNKLSTTPSFILKVYFYYLQLQQLLFKGHWTFFKNHPSDQSTADSLWPEEQRLNYFREKQSLISLWKWNGPDLIFFLIILFSCFSILDSCLPWLSGFMATQLVLTFVLHHYLIRNENLLKWCYLNITARNPWLLVACAALVTLGALWVASGLTYSPRLDNLLPQDLKLVQEFNQVIKKTGSTGPLVVVLEGLQPNQAREVIDSLTGRFQRVPDVYFVDSRLPVQFLKNRQLLFAPQSDLEELDKVVENAIDQARSSLTGFFGTSQDSHDSTKLQDLSGDYKIFENIQPFYKGKSGNRYYIFIQPRGTASNTGFTQQFVKSIQDQVDKFLSVNHYPNLKIQFSGGMITRIEENRIIQTDLKNSVVVAVILVTFILALYNRSVLSIIILFIPLITSLSLTFAFTRLLIGHVNIISGFLVAILTDWESIMESTYTFDSSRNYARVRPYRQRQNWSPPR